VTDAEGRKKRKRTHNELAAYAVSGTEVKEEREGEKKKEEHVRMSG
jgi:hypothetical protein